MADQYTAEKNTIGQLLSAVTSRIEVPDWQRNFSWDTPEIAEFWRDLLGFDDQYPESYILEQEYFLGSIVLVNREGPNELLDGQQRLATSTILLSVIRDYLARFREDAAVRTQELFIAQYDDATEQTEYKLTLNRFDRDFFRREIQAPRDGNWEVPDVEFGSHRLLRRAREYFENQFERKYEELEAKDAFRWALRVRQILTDHMSLVAISSRDEDNAAAVFETLNDRGIGLSTPDLLRNLLLRRAPEGEREEIMEDWETVLELSEPGGSRVEEFLRHYWLSTRGDVKTRSLFREMRATIEAENMSSLRLTRDLESAAETYADLVAARDDDEESRRYLAAIQAMNAKALLPAALSGYMVGDIAERRRLLRALVSLYVRHSVIGRRESTVLEARVYRVAVALRKTKDFDAAVDDLLALAPTDPEFKADFARAEVSKMKVAGYLLRELEEARRADGEVKPPKVVHVEHIYPRKPASGRWKNHDDYINRLGNLTLLAHRPNKSIKNSAFPAKKEKAYAKSDISLTRALLDHAEWTSRTVEQRQASMADEAATVWPLQC